MMQDPFADIPMAAPASRGPTRRVIQGSPRGPTPQTAPQARQDELAVALAQERLRREQAEAVIAAAGRPAAIRAAEDPAGTAGVDQRRMAGFYSRAARSNTKYERSAVPPRGVVGQALADTFPRLGNVSAGTERQMAEAAQADFIAATLRYESGAAIPEPELEAQRRRYFPQPGDAPETIALKSSLRADAIEGLRQSAGQAAFGVELNDDSAAPTALATADTMLDAFGADNLAPRNDPAAGGIVAGTGGQRAAPSDRVTAVNVDPGFNPNESLSFDPGQQELSRDSSEMVVDEARRNALVRIQRMMLAGRPDAEILGEAQALGGPGNIPMLLQERRRMGLAAFRRRAPGIDPSSYTSNTERTREEVAGDAVRQILDPNGSTEAGIAGALDTASLGLPGLVSEEYRRRMGDLRERNPIASGIGSVVGGLAAPVAGTYGPAGIRAGMSLPQMSARTMASGSIYGFNSSGGDPVNALVGGAIGGAAPSAFNLAGRAVRRGYNALARPGNYADPEARALASAFDEENIPGSRPLLDPSTRDRAAYLESNLGSSSAIRTPLEATRDALENRAGQLAGTGTAEELGTMGQRIVDAGRRFIKRSGAVATRMYDRAAQLAGDTPIVAREAVAELDDQLARLQRLPNSNKGEISFLEGLRADLVDEAGNLKPLTVGDIRDLRTGLRGRVSENNLTFSQVEGRVLGILGRAADDIERDLGGAAAPAVRAYRRADRFYAERAAEIRQVVQRVIGRRNDNLSGEQVMARIRAMAGPRGNSEGLSRLWGRLSPEEQADAAATIAETAGRRGADEAFSPAQLVTWARTLSPSARQTIFGPEGARSISNLVKISQALQATTGRLNNSRSGMVRNWGAALRGLVSGGPIGAGLGMLAGGSAVTSGVLGLGLGAATAGAGMGLRNLSARALMNKDLSRWLAAGPRARVPEAIRRHIDRLQLVARANPAISQEVTGLRQALLNAVNDNAPVVSRAAASGGSDAEGE